MKNNLILKTIISCLLGILLWCGIYYVICLIKDESYVETFFTARNLIELAICSVCAGLAYYTSQKKMNK